MRIFLTVLFLTSQTFANDDMFFDCLEDADTKKEAIECVYEFLDDEQEIQELLAEIEFFYE